MNKRILCITALLIVMFSGCKKSTVLFLDSKGNEIKDFTNTSVSESYDAAFVDLAYQEAVEILSQLEHCGKRHAENLLKKGDYVIHTTWDEECYKTIRYAYKELINPDISFGCAIVDLNGKILASYSVGNSETSIISKKMNPYSSFKPLSVYAPAIESSSVCWSTAFEDSPYKKVQDSNGYLYDWPVNASGKYSKENITIYEGIRKSLNTVAVKCLSEYGVTRSLDFLSKNFGIELQEERIKSQIYGQEEIIGNIAMGYISKGVSIVDMAGYYQAFANDGKYIKPYTVTAIYDKFNQLIYKNEPIATQSLQLETAYILNHLLQGVVAPGGTGEEAYVDGLEIGGKTGTGNAANGNWFVGFSPEYACAVWHGIGLEKNLSPAVFNKIFSHLKHTQFKFKDYSGVVKKAYCVESGLLLSEKCQKMDIGYFLPESIPRICNIHQ